MPRLAARTAAAAVVALVLATAPAPPAAAQGGDELRIEVVVDRPRPALDDAVQVTYVFHGTATAGSIKAPQSLPLKNLAVVWGPGTSTQIQFMNGNLQKSVSVSWRLRPLAAGTAEIGETSWIVGDKPLKGTPYLLEVGPARRAAGGPGIGGPGGAAPGPDEEDPMARPFGAPFPGYRNAGASRPRPDALVLYSVTPDRTTAYVGEEIVLHYELITQADISGLEYVEAPKFQGVWAEDLEKPDKPEGRRDTYEGRTVTRFTLLKKAIAPLAPGTVTIPPATVRLAVRTAADPFADPFAFMRPTLVERSTKPVSIKVLPIPGHADFKGPVGRFDLHASVDRPKIAGGEAVTLKVRMTGAGNLRTSADPPHLEIPGARVYPPTAKTSTSRTTGKAVAQAEWSYVIVPATAGDFTIPPVRIAVFDTVEKRVVDKATAPLHVYVEGSGAVAAQGVSASAGGSGGSAETVPAAEPAAPSAGASSQAAGASVQAAGASAQAALGAAPAPPAGAPSTHGVDFTSGTVTLPFWALLGIPLGLIVAGGTVLAVRKRIRSRGEVDDALRGGPDEPKERAAARIDRALRVLLQKRYGIPESAPSSAILEALETAGVPADLRESVRLLLSELDFLRFAPQLGEYGEKIDEARKQAAKVFRQIR